MIALPLEFKSGMPVYEQAIYAVKKALIAGLLKPGDEFPSVRKLSQEWRINPNTAHKIVATLTAEGLLEVRPGIGTFVAATPQPDPRQRQQLLGNKTERLVVEARNLGVDLSEVLEAVKSHWKRLQ